MPLVHRGVVTSIAKMEKTITVTVGRMAQHKKTLKMLPRSTKYLVHDENHVSYLGDKVSIIHGIRYSNRKHFRLQTIDRRGKDPQLYAQKAPEWQALEARLRQGEEARAAEQAEVEKKKELADEKRQRQVQLARDSGIATSE